MGLFYCPRLAFNQKWNYHYSIETNDEEVNVNERRVLKLIVTVPATPGVSKVDWQKYVSDAVKSHVGGLDPEDDIYGFDRDVVKVVVKNYLHDEGYGPSEAVDPNTPIEDLELQIRTFNALKKSGVDTLYDLCSLDNVRLMKLPGLGRRSAVEVEDTLASRGYSFGYFDREA